MLKVRWIAATNLSLVRQIRRAGQSRVALQVAIAGVSSTSANASRGEPVELTAAYEKSAEAICLRLASDSVREEEFWNELVEETLQADEDTAITPQTCEIALLRAGGSQLQSDQVAASLYRAFDSAKSVTQRQHPRLSEQIRLRYAPLKEAFEAYGPGMLKEIGERIWNGTPPKDWWPSSVNVFAVKPIVGGAASRSEHHASMWAEAVLTDVSPNVPEWLRLVYHLVLLCIESQTRTHVSGEHADRDLVSGESELPWAIGSVPLVLACANERVRLGDGEVSPDLISEAIELWTSGTISQTAANTLSRWWKDEREEPVPFAVSLKRLKGLLRSENTSESSVVEDRLANDSFPRRAQPTETSSNVLPEDLS